MLASSEMFTAIDFAKVGYKILIMLYNELGKPMSPETVLKLTFRDEIQTIYDHYNFVYNDSHATDSGIIMETISIGLSPLILHNVSNLSWAKEVCEEAVKNDYLVEVIEYENKSIMPQIELFKNFGLSYKQEIPRFRNYPPIPDADKKYKNYAIIQKFIQDKYANWMEKNMKEDNPWNTRKKGKVDNGSDLENRNYNAPDFKNSGSGFSKNIEDLVEQNRKLENLLKQALNKDVFAETWKLLDAQTEFNSSSKSAAKSISNELENMQINMTKSDKSSPDAIWNVSDAKTRWNVSSKFTAPSTSSEQENMQINMTKSDKSSPDDVTESKRHGSSCENEICQKFASLEEDIKEKFVDTKEMTTRIMKDYLRHVKVFAATETQALYDKIEGIHKKYEKINSATMGKMEGLLAELKSSSKSQVDVLSNCVDTQLSTFLKTTQDDINNRLEENNNMIMKKIDIALKEMRTSAENQMEILSKRIEEQRQASMKSLLDEVNKNVSECSETMSKNLHNILTANKPYDLKQTETLSTLSNRLQQVDISSEDEVQKELNQKSNTAGKDMEGATIDSSSDKVTDVKMEQKVYDELSNIDNKDEHCARTRQKKIQNPSPKETQAMNNAYQKIISFIRDGVKVLVLMRGLPGSGKTYLAKKLLKEGLGVIDTSEFIFDPLKKVSKNDLFKDGEASHMYTIRKCLEAMQSGISPVILDRNNLLIEDMKIFCRVAVRNRYMVEILEVNTPWALNVSVLAKNNTFNIDETEIQYMLDRYERNVSSQRMLDLFDLAPTRQLLSEPENNN